MAPACRLLGGTWQQRPLQKAMVVVKKTMCVCRNCLHTQQEWCSRHQDISSGRHLSAETGVEATWLCPVHTSANLRERRH
ncbi:hypothetical protein BaRGS_00031685, partial [Batillaria attramentaria]